MRRILIMALGLGALAGCEVTQTPADLAYLDRQDETIQLRALFAGVPSTSVLQIPTTGAAVYEGTTVLNMATPARTTELIGQATITSNFVTDRVTGSFGNFSGSVNGDFNSEFAGTLALANGEIDVSQTNEIEADVFGVLNDGDDLVTVNGGIVGGFVGSTPQGISAKADTGTTFVLNGTQFNGGMSVLADCIASTAGFSC